MRDAGGIFTGRSWGRRLAGAILLVGLATAELVSRSHEAHPLGTGPVDIRYAPAADLEAVDLSLIRSARRSLDIAAYLFTDRPLVEALADAASRGVRVRLYLDGAQEASGSGFAGRARGRKGAERIDVRAKPSGGEIMHLKSYAVDGHVLRTGSANFTFSGLKREDDDVIVIRDRAAVAAFEANFERMWQRGENIGEAGEHPRD